MTLQHARLAAIDKPANDIAEASMLPNPSTMKIATVVVSLPQHARASIQVSAAGRCSRRPALLLNLQRADANALAAFRKSRNA